MEWGRSEDLHLQFTTCSTDTDATHSQHKSNAYNECLDI